MFGGLLDVDSADDLSAQAEAVELGVPASAAEPAALAVVPLAAPVAAIVAQPGRGRCGGFQHSEQTRLRMQVSKMARDRKHALRRTEELVAEGPAGLVFRIADGSRLRGRTSSNAVPLGESGLVPILADSHNDGGDVACFCVSHIKAQASKLAEMLGHDATAFVQFSNNSDDASMWLARPSFGSADANDPVKTLGGNSCRPSHGENTFKGTCGARSHGTRSSVEPH